MVDVGGGTGFCTQGVVRTVPASNVTLLDQSPHQLAKARKKADLQGVTVVQACPMTSCSRELGTAMFSQQDSGPENELCQHHHLNIVRPCSLIHDRTSELWSLLHMVQGDAEDLPFPNDSFDRYVSAGSIEYWPEPQRGIREAYRVTRGGGLACLIGPVHPTFWLSRFFADCWMLFPTEDEYLTVISYPVTPA